MTLRKDVRELLSKLPGRHPHLESVWWLKAPNTFRVTPDGKVEVLRPEWLGPEPTITRLSEIPGELSDAFEIARHQAYLELYWCSDGDADVLLTSKGSAALAGEPTARPEEVPLLERVLAVLTPNQGRILEYLWTRKTASYDALRGIPKAWRENPTDEAITAALKKMRTKLDKHNLSVVSVTIKTASRRVNLDHPAE